MSRSWKYREDRGTITDGEKWGGVKPNVMQTKCIGCLENKPKDISGKTSEIK